jgi:hypothetical protein
MAKVRSNEAGINIIRLQEVINYIKREIPCTCTEPVSANQCERCSILTSVLAVINSIKFN